MKKKKTLNIILISIFIFFLYIPSVTYIFLKNKITTENLENRTLAPRPSFSIDTITSFPKQFEDYYNDHLPYRNNIVINWRNLHYKIFDESLDDKVLIGKNENNEPWLFYDNIKKDDEISFIDGRKTVTQEEMDTNLRRIKEETQKLKDKKIDLYYIICPNKSTIYSQYLPKIVNISEDYFIKIYNYLKDNGVNNLYYSVDLLKEASKIHETYYRTDTHWNSYGAFLYVKDILNGIYGKEILKETSIEESFFDSNDRDLHKFMGISIKIKENKLNVSYENKKSLTPKRVETNNGYAEVFENKDYLINETVLLVGDSFTTASSPYFISLYKKVIRVQFNWTKYDKELVEMFNPDKIFYIRVERSLPESLNFEFID